MQIIWILHERSLIVVWKISEFKRSCNFLLNWLIKSGPWQKRLLEEVVILIERIYFGTLITKIKPIRILITWLSGWGLTEHPFIRLHSCLCKVYSLKSLLQIISHPHMTMYPIIYYMILFLSLRYSRYFFVRRSWFF